MILERSDSIDNTGKLVWQLIVSLFVAWVIVYLMVVRGIKVKFIASIKNIFFHYIINLSIYRFLVN